jgi:diguanylate cyclase (GGDEF)-like protein/putative nucleotidyltransferase with HDIG domain
MNKCETQYENNKYTFEEIFDLIEIQKIQDAFALATGVASVITDVNGKYITKPSNYCKLCIEVIQGCSAGKEKCTRSHSVIEDENPEGPSFKYCLSAGMMDGGACIYVANKHIANWLIGQVLEDTVSDEKMMEYCSEIGADEIKFREALKNVKRMSKEQYLNICNAVFLFAKQLSILGVHNIKLKDELAEIQKREEEISYLSVHDVLTGLYNRRYFEDSLKNTDEIEQLPISIIMGDVNGLKMANDVFGHSEGDKLLKHIGDIFGSSSNPQDIVARIGGDEFAIIMPGTNFKTAARVVEIIKKKCAYKSDGPIQPSVAIGLAEKKHPSQNLIDIYKEAEDRMYNNKLVESKSTRSSIIESLRKTLEEKTHETEEHCRRLKNLMLEIARQLGLSEVQFYEYELLGILHDIGKVAIPDHILEKPDKLNNDEWRIMRNHSEIGYRIAASTPELIGIADAILCHHERWDGKGYPQGLSGDQIPLSSRVLSVVDAFDAMINDRPYRKALAFSDAIEEIKRCCGTQFDPKIAEIFLKVVCDNKMIN